MDLIILGNGFDIQHGIKSRYADFRAFLQAYAPEVLAEMREYYPEVDLDKFWCDFEASLPNFNCQTLMSEHYSVSSYRGVGRPEFENDELAGSIRDELARLLDDIMDAFIGWVVGVDDLARSSAPSSYLQENLPLRGGDLYLTFNYTHTLEYLYKINSEMICHIHGDVYEVDNIIVGHCKDSNEWLDGSMEEMAESIFENDYGSEAWEDASVYQAAAETRTVISEWKKDTSRCMYAHATFFDSVKDIENVYIYGHSLAAVDAPYFWKIIEKVDLSKVKWHVFMMPGEDYKVKTLLEYGVPQCNLIPHNIPVAG